MAGISRHVAWLIAASPIGASLGVASAQSATEWPDFHWSSVVSQDVPPGRMPERPAYDDYDRKDVFQVKTVDVKPGELREELPVGEYDQPQWTTFRRFPSTRIYLQTPPGGVQFEQWIEFRKPRGGDPDETRVRQELEFGLGNRLQLDLYLRQEHVRDDEDSTYEWAGYSAEIRYALADWDVIWGNPTLYFEWVFNDGEADVIEPKLLLGGEITTGWHWGSNLIHERSLDNHDDHFEEWAATLSISRTIIDELFSIGATGAYTYVSEPGSPQREYLQEVHVGPSFQIIPHPRAALNLEPLWGLTNDSKRFKMFIVFSWHF